MLDNANKTTLWFASLGSSLVDERYNSFRAALKPAFLFLVNSLSIIRSEMTPAVYQ
jgi:hypothetical protein